MLCKLSRAEYSLLELLENDSDAGGSMGTPMYVPQAIDCGLRGSDVRQHVEHTIVVCRACWCDILNSNPQARQCCVLYSTHMFNSARHTQLGHTQWIVRVLGCVLHSCFSCHNVKLQHGRDTHVKSNVASKHAEPSLKRDSSVAAVPVLGVSVTYVW
jgi:hypothetical protein